MAEEKKKKQYLDGKEVVFDTLSWANGESIISYRIFRVNTPCGEGDSWKIELFDGTEIYTTERLTLGFKRVKK